MASTQEVEMLKRQLDELTAQMIEIRQQSSSTAMNAAVTGLTEGVRTMGQSVSKPRPQDMTCCWKVIIWPSILFFLLLLIFRL